MHMCVCTLLWTAMVLLCCWYSCSQYFYASALAFINDNDSNEGGKKKKNIKLST